MSPRTCLLATTRRCVYADLARLERLTHYLATGKKLDMGTSCVRFKRVEDLPLDVLGDAMAEVDVDAFLALAAR